MDNIAELYQKRNDYTLQLLDDAYNFRDVKDIPFLFNTANYFSFGYPPEEVPVDYYTSRESQYNNQIGQFERHYELIDDNFVPYLMPWFGTGVTASAFGVPVKFFEDKDPSTEYGIVNAPEDIDRLRVPDPTRDGLMPRVIEQIEYYMRHSKLPIGFTDNHGPLTLAVQIIGYENLFYWMSDYPQKVHAAMDVFAETVIMWVEYQKKLLGHRLNYMIGNQGAPVPPDVGIWFADDDAVIMPPDLYREFVVPYNEKILKHFGGGIVHYCGNGNQHIDSFLSQKWLRAINNFGLADIENVVKIRRALDGKVVYVMCDFTPMDYFGYYDALFEDAGLSKAGLVVQSLFAPTTAAVDGKYVLIDRDEAAVAKDMDALMRKHFRA